MTATQHPIAECPRQRPHRWLAGLAVWLAASASPAAVAAPASPRHVDDDPVAAAEASIQRLRQGDFAGLWQHNLPPADFRTLVRYWPAGGLAALDPQQAAHIDAALAQLTQPQATHRLAATLLPRLAQANARYGDQQVLLVAVGRSLIDQGIVQNPYLNVQQKQQVQDVVAALVPWLQSAPAFDPARARQAIAVAVATAHRLPVQHADALRGLDFSTSMRLYRQLFLGLEQVLALYGLSLPQSLDSAHAQLIDRHGNIARVRIHYQLHGQPLSMVSLWVRQHGHWYSKDAEDVVARMRQAPPPPPDALASANIPATKTAPR